MKPFRLLSLGLALLVLLSRPLAAQTVNASQQVALEGLRSASGYGNFTAAEYAADGSLFLLLDQHDGVRILKTDATGSTVLAQAQAGAAGDVALAMALDPAGNVYVVGTSTSGVLAGTSGTPFPSPADTSTNSFLAKYDANLNLIFLTFLGSGRTAAAGVAATADSAFVTGITFNAAFPVTPAGIQQTPAKGSSENGFVERFSADGTTLVYATYLTGANGSTIPAAIAADSSDNAYITGATSATGYPTLSALVPAILGSSSGFLTELPAAGDGFTFSTFIPGNGLSSIAFDANSQSLLLSGNVALGQFPVATVAMPLTSASYQTLLRIPANGQSVSASVLLAPGPQSFASVGPDGTAWVSGALSTPLFPGATQPDYFAGDSFLLHLTAANAIDQTLRFGGLPVDNPGYAALASTVAAPAVAAAGTTVALPGTIAATASAALLATQTFDLPLVQTPNAVLPNTLADVLPAPASCTNSSQCSGSGALLALVTTVASAPSLSLSAGDLPNLTLRNLGSATASGLSLSASGYTLASNCGATLEPSNQCSIALTGAGPGSITVSAANALTYTLALPANTLAPDAIAVSTGELDFGIVTSTSSAATQTLTVSNLSATSQTFSSALDSSTATTPYAFTQTATTCASAGAANTFTLASGGSCSITLGLTASSAGASDGPASAFWKIGPRDIKLTGFSQAASLSVSAAEVDFGTQFSNTPGLDLPRYVYLSNNSTAAIAHAAAALPAGSPFTVADACPSTLGPRSVCQITLTYLSSAAPSSDSAVLTLDDGLSVLLTGETLPPASATGSTANPNLSVTPSSLSFATPVAVTGISGTTQTVSVSNTGSSAFPLSIAVSGDFSIVSGCPSTLGGGASCNVLVSFAPSQPGQRQGLLSVTAGSSFAPTYVALSGAGSAILPANDGTLDLGEAVAGEPVIAWYQVQQSFPSLTVASSSPLFGVVLVAGTPPATLPPSSFASTATGACADCYIGIEFLSQTAGPAGGTLTLSTVSGGNPYSLTLAATALPVAGLLLTPITQDFGTIAVDSSSPPMTFTLADLLPGSSSVTITSVSASGDFSVQPNATGGASCSGTLAPTASCYIQVAFAPTAIGERTGTLTVVTSGGTATASLSGDAVVDPGLSLNPDGLVFNSQPGAAATQQTIAVTNTGAATLTVGTLSVSDPSFLATSTCATLAPAATCSITVQFAASSGPVSASLSVPVMATLNGQTTSTVYAVPLTGSYTAEDAGLEILPGEVNFGSTATGALGDTRQFTLNNLTSKQLAVTLTLPRQFPLADAGACATLAANASCSFSVSFLPSTAGALTGTVFAAGAPSDGSAGVQALAYMLGYGVGSGSLAITGTGLIPNSALNFGNITSGQSTQQTLTLTNSGTTPVTIQRITSDPPFFSTSTCGATLAPNAACTVTLSYAPINELLTGSTSTSPRADAGELIVESNAASGPLLLDLTGAATPVFSSSPASSAVLATFDLSQGSLTFPNTAVGDASAAQTVTLTNTGTATLHVLSTLASTDFTATTNCATLLPGATCNLTVSFTPTTASSSSVRSGTLEISSDAATSLEFISLLGVSSAAPLTLNPVALNFGTLNAGSSAQLGVTVTNNTAAPITFTGLSAGGDYSASAGDCPADGSTLAANASCTLQVTFTPSAAGAQSGTLGLSTNATTLPLTVSLTGVAVAAQLQVTPGALNFGSIAVGAPSSLTLTLLNSGTATLTNIATTVTGADSSEFAVTAPCSTTQLAPNQGCTVVVTFTPSSTGAQAATLDLASSAPASPLALPLTGTGSQPGSFTLTVGGGSSASATVASGSPAVFTLALTPLNGFTGAVALTCTPVVTAPYGSCSLLASTLTLNGSALSSTATINTITSTAGITAAAVLGAGLLFGPLIVFGTLRRRGRGARLLLYALLAALDIGAIAGCGGGSPAGNSSLRYTPAGSYQYQVTATSTSGAQVSSTVTLNLTVQ